MKKIYLIVSLLFITIILYVGERSVTLSDKKEQEVIAETNEEHSRRLEAPRSVFEQQAHQDFKKYMPDLDIDKYGLNRIEVTYWPPEKADHFKVLLAAFSKKEMKEGKEVMSRKDDITLMYNAIDLTSEVRITTAETGKYTTQKVDLENIYTPKSFYIDQAIKDIKKNMPDLDLKQYTFSYADLIFYRQRKDISVIFKKVGSERKIKKGNSTEIKYDTIRMWYDSSSKHRRSTLMISENDKNTPKQIYYDKF